MIPITLYGIIVKPLSYIIPIKKKEWIFGADCGNMYREGSKYMLEYMLRHHPDYQCTFITRNPQVKKDLNIKGIPCELNFSIKGIWKVLRAEVVFTTQVATDILLVYKKKNRRFFFLSHGQPYKAVFNATPPEYNKHFHPKKTFFSAIWKRIYSFLTYGYTFEESEFYTSTSEFLTPYNKLFYGKGADVRILGMPRNDALFQYERMKSERWLPGLERKLVVTYMPTHRDYGKGKVSPIPFIDNAAVQQWMRENDVVFIVKQHPNMEKKSSALYQSDVIIDITKMKLDPQVVLYHSDAVVSDYSSVWIDFLILRHPVIFYYYDNFVRDDTGLLYDIADDPPGAICNNQDELFEVIKRIRNDYSSMCPSDRIVRKYHKYDDGNSCERYFEAIEHNRYAEVQ